MLPHMLRSKKGFIRASYWIWYMYMVIQRQTEITAVSSVYKYGDVENIWVQNKW